METKTASTVPSQGVEIDLVDQNVLFCGKAYSSSAFGKLEEGDLIKVENIGAYCYNLAWEITYKKPKIYIKR